METALNLTRIGTLLIIAVAVIFVGCSDEPIDVTSESSNPLITLTTPIKGETTNLNVAAAPGASNFCPSWHGMSDQQRNCLILNTANKYLGQRKGQCKIFVDDVVVKEASGGLVDLPPNQGAGANHCAEWVNDSSNPDLKIVAKNMSLTNFSFIQPGQVIQFRFTKSGSNCGHASNTLLHTAIVNWVSSPTQMEWIDSNWVATETVGKHTVSLDWWRSNVQAFTIYQVK